MTVKVDEIIYAAYFGENPHSFAILVDPILKLGKQGYTEAWDIDHPNMDITNFHVFITGPQTAINNYIEELWEAYDEGVEECECDEEEDDCECIVSHGNNIFTLPNGITVEVRDAE